MNISSTRIKTSTLSIVIPCYNEEEVLLDSAEKLELVLTGLIEKKLVTASSQILFIDDGSKDNTWQLIYNLSENNEKFNGLKLSRNFGHQAALLAGLLSVSTDITVCLDADLQDNPQVIGEMIEAYYNGAEIVYGVRSSRAVDTFMKKFTALAYYKLLKFMGVDIIEDHADFRLMSAKALKALKTFPEVNLFLRGMIPLIGYPTKIVKYERMPRLAGETKYSFMQMLAFAIDGITSFSSVPLKFIAWLGAIISIVAVFFSIWTIGIKLFGSGVVPGWASTVVPIYLIGGVQLLSLGVIGVYLSKIYDESKSRPRFIIEEILKKENTKSNF